jgi:hypothetical protein
MLIGMRVRRLAAIDMYGATGRTRRRWIILAEFVLAALGAVGLGLWAIVDSDDGWRILGAWLVGVGLNYVPLAAHATTMMRPTTLAAELADADVGLERTRLSLWQLWLLVPLALVVLAVRDARQDGQLPPRFLTRRPTFLLPRRATPRSRPTAGGGRPRADRSGEPR